MYENIPDDVLAGVASMAINVVDANSDDMFVFMDGLATAAILYERESAAARAYIPLQKYVDALNAGDSPEAVTFILIKDVQAAIRKGE